MKVEIWSDVVCPFCYIGKRHFEEAVSQLPSHVNLEVEWKSFELDPNAKKDSHEDLYDHLAHKYGQSREWAVQTTLDMTQKAKSVGLEFNFDKSVSTNTFDAHRLIQLAKSKGRQDEAEEALFKAYFTDGRHIGEVGVLMEIGQQIGLDAKEVEKMLDSDEFATEVRADESLSREFGIRGVPFFVVNRKYGISGAQPVAHMLDVLRKAGQEDGSFMLADSTNGESCGAQGCG
ncbi:MAG: DsbA family oxidoreductase [Cyclobacteriaceae bacterium]|nr:DsbA family oxidoreductase [Cyclobacteriaceae bacterium]